MATLAEVAGNICLRFLTADVSFPIEMAFLCFVPDDGRSLLSAFRSQLIFVAFLRFGPGMPSHASPESILVRYFFRCVCYPSARAHLLVSVGYEQARSLKRSPRQCFDEQTGC